MDPAWLLERFGAQMFWVSCAIVFIECGLLFPILPGDSLLFSVGMFINRAEAGQAGIHMSIWLACLLLSAFAFAGNVVGYEIGRAVGPAIFRRNGRFTKREYFDKTHEFFERYGNKALVIGRFVPIVRTFCPIVAGAGQMEYGTFVRFNVVGGFLWGVGVTLLGYFLGNVPLIADNIEIALLMVVAVSLIPIAIEVIKSRRAKTAHAAG